jgi:Carboxypeptidase regulatory-like domain
MRFRSFVDAGFVLAALTGFAAPALAFPSSHAFASGFRATAPVDSTPPVPAGGDVAGTVTDSTSGAPIAAAQVTVERDSVVIANTSTDAFGSYRIHGLVAGTYTLSVHFLGYAPESHSLAITNGDVTINVRMHAVAISLQAVKVSGAEPVAVDTRTGDQVFQQNDYHGAPSTTTSQIIQQSIAGAARAPTGEVHIRGQHDEYSYYIDGIPIPSGVSGSLNELFDPQIVNQIDFQTGGWDAEYGNKNTAIINVTTRIPTGAFHMNLSGYAGQYDSKSTTGGTGENGQSLSMSGNSGAWGFFASGTRQSSDMRQEPVMLDTLTNQVTNLHNSGDDQFGFGKIQYSAGTHDVVTLDVSDSRTHFGVPYDTSGGAYLDDHQTDINAFENLAWHHMFGDSTSASSVPSELFTGLFARQGSLHYVPGSGDQAQFIFYPDTTPYDLTENRNFDIYGLKVDYTYAASRETQFMFGTLSSVTSGHEDFSTTTQSGAAGPASNSGLSGSDVGVYAQTVYSPIQWFQLRAGLRYDAHTAPFAATQTQLSPRVRFNFFPTPQTSFWVYYGRQFIPTNIEDLRAITSISQSGLSTQPTLPERDNFYELGITHRFTDQAVVAKASYYKKDSGPGIDDNTVPGSAIVTDVNIQNVHIQGIEGVLQYQPTGPFSAYVNAALNHADGTGAVTGGFFPAAPPAGYFDLDHDQRLSIVGSFNYAPAQWYLTGSVIYGSGLSNGVDPSDCGCTYGTGLFDFNSGIKVNPSTIVNASLGYTFVFGQTVVQPQIYVENLFDSIYILKGAFFSGTSVGRPRNIELRVNIGM